MRRFRLSPLLLLLLPLACGRTMDKRTTRISRFEAQRNEALNRGDRLQASRATLALDREIELDAAEVVDPEAPGGRARVERKYELLGQRLEVEAQNAASTDLTARTLPIAYNPKELAAVKEVTKDYGDLYVGPTAGFNEFRLPHIPWAGYWYPASGAALYGTPDTPLAKLDQLAQAVGRPGGIVQWEKDHASAVPLSTWEGFCDAWALAATQTPEPRQTLTYKGVRFAPHDLKAILTKAFQLYPVKQYGIRYDGDFATDGTFQDIRPEAFQRLIEAVVLGQKRPLVIDDAPGVEVWSKPLFGMRWRIDVDPEVPNAYRVKLLALLVSHRRAISDKPTTENDVVPVLYQYRLFVDPQVKKDGRSLVIAGEWLGDSLSAHPDYVLVPAQNGAWSSPNQALNGSLDLVRELLSKGTPRAP